jgi:hypothetical protein
MRFEDIGEGAMKGAMKRLLLTTALFAFTTLVDDANAIWFKVIDNFNERWECRITEVSNPARTETDDGSAMFGRVLVDAARVNKRTSMNVTFIHRSGTRYEKKSLYKDIFVLVDEEENSFKVTWSGIGLDRPLHLRAVGELHIDRGAGATTYVERLYEDGELISKVAASACTKRKP